MTRMNRRAVGIRTIGAVNATTGLALLARPEAVVAAVTSGRTVPAQNVVRLLGARLGLQGLLLSVAPRRRVVALCAVVDLAHAASMYGLGALRPRYRRAALVSAATATVSGLLSAAAARATP